ncbi:nucleoside triphosphate pyrophosphohydrolase [Oharaeibacter diazotrophicus]|uniref:Nucleoside triphosphate pyrophosphohydrolase n=1 Tax=Oharaeibacter diazotrophicus TaxID=1920512 RepID=A0A4R6RKV4_9HYPH|nr:nucleoside triphosphate pyrophosphohydrolase [Oharaeibacter diazotrophicus]TDP86725.1 ATP diphosphatase [Oharaeibacter diazotrophicus]BBE71332.1 nucleoside triphosphate pyrophosphohydrolase [Pleomorphomonas sp. SM30]GLS78088.1 nucleoside triphosphate pyrophosphohydrolase [Oharaeibacter diazotrophicus]
MRPGRDIETLIAIMERLRDPATGCAWDVVQTFETIAPYTVEEAHEVADAIARGDRADLCDELGDLLLQVVFHARIAEEEGAFAFPDVVEAITGKMIRRHPHVFGPEDARSPEMAKGQWSRIKAEEKAERRARRAAAGLPTEEGGLLADVPAALPGLAAAVKLQDRAGSVGFDWNDPKAVIAKIREEIDELEAEVDAGAAADRVEAELGDVLFALANLGRHLKVDPDSALRRTNLKFRRRFAHIEAALARTGRTPADADLAEMEALWQEAKGVGEG